VAVAPLRGSGELNLIFRGVEQAGPSFEGRVFVTAPDATDATPRTVEEGYLGSFHVYGYGQPLPPGLARRSRDRDSPVVAPIEKQLQVSGDQFFAALQGADSASITVVAIPARDIGPAPNRPIDAVEIIATPDRNTG
jgi:hypothetical protein